MFDLGIITTGIIVIALAMSVPLWINVIMHKPIEPDVIIIESLFLGAIGLTGIYLTARGIERYVFVIKEQAKLHEDARKHTRQLQYYIRLKDLFTDIITHDLVNPVGVIKNYAELLLDREEDKEKRVYLESLKRSSEKVVEIIENAAKFAKLESVDSFEFKTQDLNAIFRSVVEDFKPMLEEKAINIEYKIQGECLAMVNPIIEDVFANLLSNAIKYSPKGKKIVIDAENKNDYWDVAVKDYGIGIPDEDKPGLFERFARVSKGGVKGTGLGLAIVKRAVELHGGEVWIEDNPEGGSIFHVGIPKNH